MTNDHYALKDVTNDGQITLKKALAQSLDIKAMP